MNKNQFRIIFNRTRGIMMAVAEHAKSHSSGKGAESSVVGVACTSVDTSEHTATIRPLFFSLMLALGMVGLVPNSLSIPLAHADIIADQTAAANQRPMVTQAANGVPLVNIQTPSAAGVSRNTYSQFDVSNQGVILNNSRTNVQTQLGGFVQGNPYLAAGTARIILNEVNSSNPSLLNGYIEIAGTRAQLVIANPAGISCNGCGFINANRTTLTTGTPIMNSGDLIGYRVTGGEINFLGAGLDTSQSNYTDIIARAVNINAGVFANNLNIITGPNQVNVASTGDIGSIVPIAGTGSVPSFALDVAALGGMYAGKIHMIGTEAGLGVRNAGEIGASAGNVTIDVNGMLTNTATGRIVSQQNTQIQVSQDLDNAGVIYSGGNTTLTTQGNLTNVDTIAANGNLTISANGANSSIYSGTNGVLAAGLNADGTLGSSGNLTATATQSITALGQNLAAEDQTLSAQALDLTGSQAIGRNLTFTASNGNLNATNSSINATGILAASATQTLITDDAVISANQLNLAALDLSNIAGELIQTGVGNTSINLAGDLNNNQGRIATNSANLVVGAQTLTNTDGSIEHAGNGTLTINATTLNGTGGAITSNSNLDLTVQNATLDGGSTIASQINIDTVTLSNRAGEIIQRGTGTSTIAASASFDNTGGTLASNGSTTLAVGNLINQGGSIQLASASNLTLNATGLIDNTAIGVITAGGFVNIEADQLLNATGEITAAQSLTATLAQALDNSQGLLAANQDVTVTAATIDNSQGTIASVQAGLTATATSGAINNNAGRLQAAQDINLASEGLNNTDGVVSGVNVTLNSGAQALDNTRGSIAALGTLDLQSGQLTNDAGLIQAAGSMSLNTQGQALININSGTTAGIVSQSTVTLTSGDLNNQSGFIGARGDLTANSAAITNTQGGTITSESAVSLAGTSLDNRGGQVEALDNVTVHAGNGTVDNTASLLRAGQTLSITAGSVINTNTLNATQGMDGQNVAITANTLNNTSGTIRADDALTLTGHGAINNTQGFITSSNTLNIADSNLAAKALAITNTGGTLIASTDLQVDIASLTGDGKVLSEGDITANLTSNYTQTSTGELQADGNLSLTTTGNVTNQSSILAGNTLTLNAANINNTATGEISGLDTHINASGALTNRGLIDGSDTFITAATLNNIGTGSIFGDHIAIAANTLNNNSETLSGITSAAVIAARDQLDIGAQTITNQNNSLLFSAGDMAIGGSLDANHEATVAIGESQVTTLTNRNATIEALGNLSANVANLQNLNGGITTQNVFAGITAYHQFTPRGQSVVLNAADYPGAQIGNFNISWRTAGPYTFREYYRYIYTGTTSQEVVQTSLPGQLLSGGNMTLHGNITNNDSKIIAGGLLDVSGASLNNVNTQGETSTSYSGTLYYYDYDGDESCGDSGDGCYDISAWVYNPASSVTTFSLPTTQVMQLTAPLGTGTQIGTLTTSSVNQTAIGAGTANALINPIATTPVVTTVVSTNTVNGQSVNTLVGTASPNTTVSNNSLFQTNPNPSSGYLIETNPRFANYRTWLSSDYMLNQLSYDPATTTKRLGDGFYEQKLIREQVSTLTGKRFLAGYASDEAQYQALMVNGVTFAKAFNLTPGIALTSLQMAQLTSDIVWLVEQTITLPDGSTTQALVPQVYAKLKDGDISNSGALLAGNSVRLNLTGELTNAGTIGSRNLMVLTADNINNLGGRISANDVTINAQRDINNLGGTIDAQNSLILNAGHDINVVSTTQSNQNQTGASSFTRTNLDRIAGLYVTGGQGLMVASAGNDIHLDAAQLINAAPTGTGNQTLLKAGNNLTLGTVEIAEQNNSVKNAKNYLKHGSTEEIGTSIQTTGDITLMAGNDLNVKAANVTSSEGALMGIAGNDLTVTSGEATSNMEAARYVKKSGTFSSKKTTTRDTFNDTNNIGSALSADSITLVAGANIATAEDGTTTVSTQAGQGKLNIQGSSVVATNDVNLNAGADINITASQDTHDETHYKKVKQSGLSASGASVTLGSSQLTNTNDSQQVTNVASTVGSVEGNVNINSGKTYNQTGSDILTPAGDINIAAQQVNITAATDTYNSQQTMKYKQSGITLAITSPIISAIQTAQQMSKAASQTDDTRMQALAAGTAALSANNAYNAVKAGQGTTINGKEGQIATGVDDAGKVTSRDANAADQVGGINVSISIGSSKSKSSTTQTSSTAASSNLTAGGDINITATGAGKKSDINVIGSIIKANDDVTLKAEDQINLIATQNVDTLKSKNSGSSASIGVSFGTDGLLFTASASGSKGKAKGNGTTWTETQIQSGNDAGDKVTLESGADTNVIGAQIIGNQVVANVGTNPLTGGNLNIQSLQDTNQYKDKQQSIGGSISIGYGKMGGSFNMSDSKTKSNYASVNEQAGIMAGDGGFQVDVAGNTNLTGAVIASTDKAIQTKDTDGNPINQLTMQTLTVSNIENKAEYKAKGISLGAGVNVGLTENNQPVAGVTKSIGWGSLSDDADSVTLSGISGGKVSITDTTTTVVMLNRDVKAQFATYTQGNVSATAVDSQGNNLAQTINPIFDEEKVQDELNAQIQITQAFDKAQQQFRLEINRKVDKAKAEKDAVAEMLKNQDLSEEQRIALITQGLNAQKEIEQLENMGLVFSAVASGLSAPTNSIGGIMANSLAPEAASQIGQYFKDHGTEGSATHILAHGILAGAVAALGGNNPMGAALSAMSGEMVAPLVADLLYGKPADELNAEQKATVSAIVSLSGIAVGTGIDNSTSNIAQANLAAQNAVDNNWGEVGHYSTMATVLYLAGFSTKDAKAIALAAWAPDTDKRNAITIPNINNGEDPSQPQIADHLLDGEKDPAKVIATQQSLAKDVGVILRTIKQFENDPAVKSAYLSSPIVQQVLHSFGDSFAHVQADGTHYDPNFGHLKKGTEPDSPNTNIDAYKNYVNTVFSVASQATSIPRVSNSTIINLADKVTLSTTEDGQKLILKSSIGSVTKAEATSLVSSPVKECGLGQNCQKIGVGDLANSVIRQIYGTPTAVQKK